MEAYRSVPTRLSSDDFTLKQLLVVMAIVALLVSFLFHSFSQAREKARVHVCLSNTHRVSRAVLLYAHDYDEILPPIAYKDKVNGEKK